MATANTSIRSGGAIRNAELTYWTGGVPIGYDVSFIGAATLTQLTREMEYLHKAGIPQFEMQRTAQFLVGHPSQDPLVKHESAARLFVPNGAADFWNFGIEGLNFGNFSGDALWGLPWTAGQRCVFSWWMRGTRQVNINLKIVMRDVTGANVSYLNRAPGAVSTAFIPLQNWSTTAAGLQFGMQPVWTRYSVEFMPILTDGSTFDAGLPSTDSLVFAFTSEGFGAVGTNVIADFGGFEYEIQSSRYHEES